jgi:lysophospholipase L1-like esterase
MGWVKAFVVLLAALTVGAVATGWKSEIARALKTALGMPDWTFGIENPYYGSRLEFFRQTVGVADVIMLGDSITEGGNWHELFPGVPILNRGIAGDTSAGVLNRLDEVMGRRPKIVFLLIGINDLQAGVPISTIRANIGSIVGALAQKQIRVVLHNVLYAGPNYRAGLNDKVSELNRSLSDLCASPSVSCLDLNRLLSDGEALSPSFSLLDGLHLNSAGYLAWKSEISAILRP